MDNTTQNIEQTLNHLLDYAIGLRLIAVNKNHTGLDTNLIFNKDKSIDQIKYECKNKILEQLSDFVASVLLDEYENPDDSGLRILTDIDNSRQQQPYLSTVFHIRYVNKYRELNNYTVRESEEIPELLVFDSWDCEALKQEADTSTDTFYVDRHSFSESSHRIFMRTYESLGVLRKGIDKFAYTLRGNSDEKLAWLSLTDSDAHKIYKLVY